MPYPVPQHTHLVGQGGHGMVCLGELLRHVRHLWWRWRGCRRRACAAARGGSNRWHSCSRSARRSTAGGSCRHCCRCALLCITGCTSDLATAASVASGQQWGICAIHTLMRPLPTLPTHSRTTGIDRCCACTATAASRTAPSPTHCGICGDRCVLYRPCLQHLSNRTLRTHMLDTCLRCPRLGMSHSYRLQRSGRLTICIAHRWTQAWRLGVLVRR